MRQSGSVTGVLVLLAFVTPLSLWAAEDEAEQVKTIAQGFELARKFCGRCHGEGSSQGSAKFSIIDPEGLVKEKYVVPGKPDDSFMWQRIDGNEMPPDNQPQPTAEDKAILKAWITLGAKKPARPARAFRSEEDTLAALRMDLRTVRSADRLSIRYFSLTHLHNNHDISDFDLRYYRAALAKSLNSLTWKADLVAPRAIDADATLFAIDLRQLGWEPKDWDALLEHYPYGLRYDRSTTDSLAHVAAEVRDLCGSAVSHIRGDWFAVHATRPPLYHRLLQLPETDRELETLLEVDVAENFRSSRLRRAGFAESGVSVSNRLVERHPSKYGYYWKSYDFKRSNGTGSLFQFPLGPVIKQHPFPDFAFAADGGEIIFSLPNGMQAYFLTNGEGKRIDSGPIEVVRDLKETSGTPVVVNGISCMHCHQNGMIDFRDSVRDGLAVFGDVRRKALELFPARKEMDELIAKDRTRFVRSLDDVVGRWLREPDAPSGASTATGEPIATVARFYGADVNLETAACELGLADAKELSAAIKNNPRLRKLGLGPLINGQRIDRQVWENTEAVVSPMQQVAREMDLATPYVILSQ